MAGPVTWEMSPKQLAAFEKRLERYRGLPLQKRMAKGTLSAAQYLARPVRAAAPVGNTGRLKKSVKAKQLKVRGTTTPTLGAVVSPTAPHRHLVIRGHRIVTHLGRDTGQRSTPNPFVDEAIQHHTADAFRIVNAAIFAKTP